MGILLIWKSTFRGFYGVEGRESQGKGECNKFREFTKISWFCK
jgi:hypothetical protein